MKNILFLWSSLALILFQVTITSVLADDFPLELKILILGLKSENFSDKDAQEIGKVLTNIEKNTRQKELGLINVMIKTLISQDIILYFQKEGTNSNGNSSITDESIKNVHKLVMKKENEYNPFARYLIESLETDIWNTLDQTSKKGSVMRKNNHIKKLISPIYQMVIKLSPQELNNRLRPLMIKILQKIDANITLLDHFSRIEHLASARPQTLIPLWSKKNSGTNSPLYQYSSEEYRRIKAQNVLRLIPAIESTSDTVIEVKDYWAPLDDISSDPNLIQHQQKAKVQGSDSVKNGTLEWKPAAN